MNSGGLQKVTSNTNHLGLLKEFSFKENFHKTNFVQPDTFATPVLTFIEQFEVCLIIYNIDTREESS
jgi:hypothetical protein